MLAKSSDEDNETQFARCTFDSHYHTDGEEGNDEDNSEQEVNDVLNVFALDTVQKSVDLNHKQNRDKKKN